MKDTGINAQEQALTDAEKKIAREAFEAERKLAWSDSFYRSSIELSIYAAIEAVFAHRQSEQSEPVAVQPAKERSEEIELVERMLDSFGAHYDETPKPEALPLARIAMTAAAAVCLDEVLGPVKPEELESFRSSYFANGRDWQDNTMLILTAFIKNRRVRLSAPKPVEERVQVTREHDGWHLWRDGVAVNTGPLQEGIALWEAAGLRAELKESEGKKQ